MEHLLAKAKKVAEQAEVFIVSSRETPIRFEANRLKQIQGKENTSVALRIIKKGKVGLAAASGLDDMETLIDMAVETSQFGAAVEFQFPSPIHCLQIDIFDPEVENMTAEKMIDMGEELIAKVREHAPEILCDVEVIKRISSTRIINSRGGEAKYDKSFFSLGLEGILVEDTDMLFVGDDESSCHSPSGIDIVADRIIRQLELAKNKANVSTRLLPVIFTPHGVAGALLTQLALAFNGKTVLEGISPLKNRLLTQAFDKNLNLWDDATIAYGVRSRPCDDEGVSSQRVSLIKDGVVSGFLYDLQTAALVGTNSTGNGKRTSSDLQIQPAISSLVIDEGSSSFQAMVEGMKEGLIVEQLIGSGQGDILSGDFSGNVLLGYKVENGQIVGRVKDTMISGNVYQVLKEPISVGDEARWVGGILHSPYLYCPCISVVAREK